MWRRTGVAFSAQSAKGETFRIIEDVEIIPAGSFDDPYATLEGLKRYVTDTGLTVNWKSDSDFEVLALPEPVMVKRV
jgi:hypothetical protein